MATSASPDRGAVLLTGGTGKIASRIVPLLRAAQIPTVVASRSVSTTDVGVTGVKFDWADQSTWEAALSSSSSSSSKPIRAVLLVFPNMADPETAVRAFMDLARARGVARFVLLSATLLEEGGPAMGQIHRYLRELGDSGEVGWGVLRPSWFQENFSEFENHIGSIKRENKIYSASGQGKIPWVAAEDIAAVAFHALTTPEPPNRDYLILGPELLSYGDIAEILSSVLGRKIVHHELSEEELVQRYHSMFGMPREYAAMLSGMDTVVKHGAENRTNDVVASVTGRPGRTIRELIEEKKSVWTIL